MKCIDRMCDKEAKFIVAEKSGLPNRQAEYCPEHANPFRQYTLHFEVKALRKSIEE